MVDVEVVVFGGVEVGLFGIVDVKVDTADREEVVAEVDRADREEVVADVDTADRVEMAAEVDTSDREEVLDGTLVLGADGTLEEVGTAYLGDISRIAGVGKNAETEVFAAGVTFNGESTGSCDDTRKEIYVESSHTESTNVY